MVLNYLLRPITEDRFRYRTYRADESANAGMISVDLIKSLLAADLVIADLSFLNPNVFYELGLRHFSKKPTIHIASSATPLPFDTAHHRTIFFELDDWDSHLRTREKLALQIEAVKATDYVVTNPYTVAHAHDRMAQQDGTIELMSGALMTLESKIHELSSNEIRGRPTRASINALIGNHRDEILKIVKAMRHKIDESAISGLTHNPQATDMLRRLGVIETVVEQSSAMH